MSDRAARVRRVNAKRPIPYTLVVEPSGEYRSDVAVSILLRWLDERRAREGQ